MKANEAPKKIFVTISHPVSDDYTEMIAFEHGDGIEYTRTDAFIEKACDWLESVNLYFYQIRDGVFSKQFVEDFKKYLEGE